MTTYNVKGLTKPLTLNKLTQTQFNNATVIEDDELHLVDPEFTGNKVLVTTIDGDVVESIESSLKSVSFGNAATLALENNVVYTGSEAITTLNLTIPATNDPTFIAELHFLNNATTSATITPSSSVKWIGDDCVGNVFTPRISVRYTLMIYNNGADYVIACKGV